MRAFLTISSLFNFYVCFGQEDTATLHFLNNIIKRKSDKSLIYYTDRVDAGMYDYMMKKQLLKSPIKAIGSTSKSTLTLTSAEINQLKHSLTTAKSHKWREDLFSSSKRISSDSTHSFLISDRNKDLYLFSLPAFIRNNTIALFYVVHLCCGGIYGPVDLSFYRRENGKWQKWITIDGGAF
jgi:hypothetical protein